MELQVIVRLILAMNMCRIYRICFMKHESKNSKFYSFSLALWLPGANSYLTCFLLCAKPCANCEQKYKQWCQHESLYRTRFANTINIPYHNYQTINNFKVHLTPKYFFRPNKSLHLFETHCAFFPLFNPNLDFLQTVKVTKSGHHLLHDRASKGYGSIPG